jgi:hypothetical protein
MLGWMIWQVKGLNIINNIERKRRNNMTTLTMEEKKERHREYKKQYRLKNKEKIAAKHKAYCEKNKEQISAKNKEWRDANKDKIKQYREENRDYLNAQSRKWKDANKDKVKESSTKRLYGISLVEYNKHMASSDECEICGIHKDDVVNVSLGYDHCHDTMEFRGVLCNKCNRALGLMGDTIESVEKALNYLKGVKNEFKTITR